MDLAIIDAVYKAKKLHDFDPLIDLINLEKGFILEDKDVRELLIEGLKSIKRGKGIKTKETQLRIKENKRKYACLGWYYVGLGFPKWNDPAASPNPSACLMASKELNTSPQTIRTAMNEDNSPMKDIHIGLGVRQKALDEGKDPDAAHEERLYTDRFKSIKSFLADQAEKEGDNRKLYIAQFNDDELHQLLKKG